MTFLLITPLPEKTLFALVTSSLITDLLPEAIVLPCLSVEELVEKIYAVEAKQIVIEAESHSDLSRIAMVIHQLRNKIIPVGSAGLAEKLKLLPKHKKQLK